MHFIKAYSLIIVLSILVGLGIVPSAYSYEPLPTESVEQFIDIHRSIPIAEQFREYLRPEYEDTLLPEAIIVRIVCYSDGSGQMFSVGDGEEIWHQLTKQGALELNAIAVKIGEATCTKEWEVYYGPRSLHRESKRSWYL
jgi:hypothetical protein